MTDETEQETPPDDEADDEAGEDFSAGILDQNEIDSLLGVGGGDDDDDAKTGIAAILNSAMPVTFVLANDTSGITDRHDSVFRSPGE